MKMTTFEGSPLAMSCCPNRHDSATVSFLRIIITACVCCYIVAVAEASNIDVDLLTESQLDSITVVQENEGVPGEAGVCVVQLKRGGIIELHDGDSYGGLVTMNDDCQHKYHVGQQVVRNFPCVCDPTNTETGVFCPYCLHPNANAGSPSRKGRSRRLKHGDDHRELQRGQLCSSVGSMAVMSTKDGDIERCTCAAGPDKIPTQTCVPYDWEAPPLDPLNEPPIDPPAVDDPTNGDFPDIDLNDLFCFKTNNADDNCPSLLASTTDEDIANAMCGQDDTCFNYCGGALLSCCQPASSANDFVGVCNTNCNSILTTGCHRKPTEVPHPPPPPPPPVPEDPEVPPLPLPPPPPPPPEVPVAPVCVTPGGTCSDNDDCCAKFCLNGSCVRTFKRIPNKIPLSSSLGIRGGRAGQLRASRVSGSVGGGVGTTGSP